MSEKPIPSIVRRIVGDTLMVGVYLSGVIMAIGLADIFIRGNTTFPAATSLEWIFANLVVFNPFAIIFFGFLVLVATPVIRVLISILTFAIQKDIIYVLITSSVFIILVISFFVVSA